MEILNDTQNQTRRIRKNKNYLQAVPNAPVPREEATGEGELPDLICFCHLRWDFVYQRPQHLMSRFAKGQRVFFFEEPIHDGNDLPSLRVREAKDGLTVVTPMLPQGLSPAREVKAVKNLLSRLLSTYKIKKYFAWFYSPMFLKFAADLNPVATVYDCMDELANFKGAPAMELKKLEGELLMRASVVFTGGNSLFEAKRGLHPHMFSMPSSIDYQHFAKARSADRDEPNDQKNIPPVRIGFCGVIDERMDLELINQIAKLRPEWNLVILGPVVKINPDTLPKRSNIFYLGGKAYADLPNYLGGWDVAILPFAKNESTRFISPTKTPEYLAAGRPVVSTSIHDVVHPYGHKGLVKIADRPADFVAAIEEALRDQKDNAYWLSSVDSFLKQNSWDSTWREMAALLFSDFPDKQRQLLRSMRP